MKEFIYILFVTFGGVDVSTGVEMNVAMSFDGFETLTECQAAGGALAATLEDPTITDFEWKCVGDVNKT